MVWIQGRLFAVFVVADIMDTSEASYCSTTFAVVDGNQEHYCCKVAGIMNTSHAHNCLRPGDTVDTNQACCLFYLLLCG